MCDSFTALNINASSVLPQCISFFIIHPTTASLTTFLTLRQFVSLKHDILHDIFLICRLFLFLLFLLFASRL